MGAAIAISGIGTFRGSISLTLSIFALDDGVGVREFSSEIPSPTAPAGGLSLLLSLKSLFLEELLLLLLPLSLPLRLLPGRITTNPATIPPPCSGALNEIILSLPSISPADFFFSLFPGRTASDTRGVAAGDGCVGVSDFFRRDVCSAGGGGGCLFDGLRLGFSDFVEKVGDRECPVGGLPGANLVASLVVDDFLPGAGPAATLLALDDFLVDSFLAGGAECRSPDGCCRALAVATRPDGTSASVFEVRCRCLLGDSGPGPSDDEPEEDDDDEGGGFPFAAG